jgi:drug/metabolite transporter (DMT)-like permease
VNGALLARAAPAAFVLLWSSAFVVVRGALPEASPLAFLFLRFVLAAALLGAFALAVAQDWSALRGRWHHFALAGCLINGVYLACSYVAMTRISAGTMALVGSLHPLATALLSGPLLGERFALRQWLGFALGIAGVALVVGVEADDFREAEAIAIGAAGVAALVAGTLYYARHCRDAGLVPANAVQLAAAALLVGLGALALETPRIVWSPGTVAALLYLTLAISLGGMALLLFMLKRGEAGRVSANFYLTPGTTALMGWAVLGEAVGAIAAAGIALSMAGVWLVNRSTSSRS